MLGCGTIYPTLLLYDYLLVHIPLELNGSAFNDFLFCFLKIGFVEELLKSLPFILIYFVSRNSIKDPIQIVVIFCASALGFSAVENIKYFDMYGSDIIISRAILSSVSHMCDGALIAYGVYRYIFHPKAQSPLIMFAFFLMAAISHGFYDFWIMYTEAESYGIWITVLYFLITVQWFASIVNTALNNSSNFSYKKVVDQHKVTNRLMLYYGIIFISQYILLAIEHGPLISALMMMWGLLITGIIISITVVRLSRFKLINQKWIPIRFELPFRLRQSDSMNTASSGVRIVVKGEAYNEAYVTKYYNEYAQLKSVSKRNSSLGRPRLAYIEHKVFLKNDEALFLTKLYDGNKDSEYLYILLKPKVSGETMVAKKHPLVAILKLENQETNLSKKLSSKDFKYVEWAFLVPHNSG